MWPVRRITISGIVFDGTVGIICRQARAFPSGPWVQETEEAGNPRFFFFLRDGSQR